jgi:hypothetical protein
MAFTLYKAAIARHGPMVSVYITSLLADGPMASTLYKAAIAGHGPMLAVYIDRC